MIRLLLLCLAADAVALPASRHSNGTAGAPFSQQLVSMAGAPPSPFGSVGTFKLVSPVFETGGPIDGKYLLADPNCDRRDKQKPNMPFAWQHVPPGTKSFIFLMDDVTPESHHRVHWLIKDLPSWMATLHEGISASTDEFLARGFAGVRYEEAVNNFGIAGFTAPCASMLKLQRYRFRLFARPTETTVLDSSKKPLDSKFIVDQLKDSLGVATMEGTASAPLEEGALTITLQDGEPVVSVQKDQVTRLAIRMTMPSWMVTTMTISTDNQKGLCTFSNTPTGSFNSPMEKTVHHGLEVSDFYMQCTEEVGVGDGPTIHVEQLFGPAGGQNPFTPFTSNTIRVKGQSQYLIPGELLRNGEFVISPGKTHFAMMSADGNLVFYQGSGPEDKQKLLWKTHTLRGSGDYFATIQDGNVMVYQGAKLSENLGVVWNSYTAAGAASSSSKAPSSSTDYMLMPQDDGNLCLYSGTPNNKQLVWTAEQVDHLASEEWFGSPNFIMSESGNKFLYLRRDGNLVFAKGTGPADNQGEIWTSQSGDPNWVSCGVGDWVKADWMLYGGFYWAQIVSIDMDTGKMTVNWADNDPNGRVMLYSSIQKDGKFCPKPGTDKYIIYMHQDGNLAIYKGDNPETSLKTVPTWNTNTGGRCYMSIKCDFYFIPQDDENLVLYEGTIRKQLSTVWTRHDPIPFLLSGQILQPGQWMQSEKKTVWAELLSDGNFVVKKGTGPSDDRGLVWETKTKQDNPGNGQFFVIMQHNGNLELFKGADQDSAVGDALFTTKNPQATAKFFFMIQDDLNVKVWKGTPGGSEVSGVWDIIAGPLGMAVNMHAASQLLATNDTQQDPPWKDLEPPQPVAYQPSTKPFQGAVKHSGLEQVEVDNIYTRQTD